MIFSVKRYALFIIPLNFWKTISFLQFFLTIIIDQRFIEFKKRNGTDPFSIQFAVWSTVTFKKCILYVDDDVKTKSRARLVRRVDIF